MKQVFMLLALVMLVGCAAPQPERGSSETPAPSLGPDQYDPNAEYATAEEREAWFEEQAALAEEFIEDHHELLDKIAAAILETELAEQYLGFEISPGFQDDDMPYLESFRRVSDGYNCRQERGVLSPELTLDELSEELDLLAKELRAVRPMWITYETGENGRTLTLDFATTTLPIAIFCDVYLRYEPTQENPNEYAWGVKQYDWSI